MDFCVFLRDVWQPRKKMPNSDTWTSFWGATSSYEKSQFLMGVYIYKSSKWAHFWITRGMDENVK